MKAYRCDRCGTFYEGFPFETWFNKLSYRKDICVVTRKSGYFGFEQKPKEETT